MIASKARLVTTHLPLAPDEADHAMSPKTAPGSRCGAPGKTDTAPEATFLLAALTVIPQPSARMRRPKSAVGP